MTGKLAANHDTNTALLGAVMDRLEGTTDQARFSIYLMQSLCATYPPKAFAELIEAVLMMVEKERAAAAKVH